MFSGFFSGEPAYDAPSHLSTGHHSMPRWSDTPPRNVSPPPQDSQFYADNWLWRDPMPPLPQQAPLEFALDRRVWRPAQAAIAADVVATHQRTGALDVVSWGRSSHFVEPARDIAYQSYKMLWRNRATDQRRAEQLPRNSERYAIFPDIFWTLGNPPLLDQATSRRVVGRLQERGLIDTYGRPTATSSRASVDAALRHAPGLQGVLQQDFSRYATVTLNVAYDLLHAGDKEVREDCYEFSPPQDDYLMPPLDDSTEYHELWNRHRRNDVHDMLYAMQQDYRRELLHEAVQAAASDQARVKAPNTAEVARTARVARLLPPWPTPPPPEPQTYVWQGPNGPELDRGSSDEEDGADAGRDVYDSIERYRVYHDNDLTAEQAQAVEALAERMAHAGLAL